MKSTDHWAPDPSHVGAGTAVPRAETPELVFTLLVYLECEFIYERAHPMRRPVGRAVAFTFEGHPGRARGSRPAR